MAKYVCTFFLFSCALIAPAAANAQDVNSADPGQTARPVAIVYTDAYETRAKIHKIASYATLPLLGTEVVLGQKLYDDPASRTSSYRGAHIAVGTAITGLFAVNTVTGVWNLWEARKDPHERRLRLIHGLSMLGADAGFVAAFGTGPGGRNLVNFDQNKQTHRAVALTSIGVGAGSYLLMLIGK
jgi:hypothetical protein